VPACGRKARAIYRRFPISPISAFSLRPPCLCGLLFNGLRPLGRARCPAGKNSLASLNFFHSNLAIILLEKYLCRHVRIPRKCVIGCKVENVSADLSSDSEQVRQLVQVVGLRHVSRFQDQDSFHKLLDRLLAQECCDIISIRSVTTSPRTVASSCLFRPKRRHRRASLSKRISSLS